MPAMPMVLRAVKNAIGVSIAVDAPLMSSGLDSLSSEELRKELSKATGLELPPTVAYDHPTVAALAAFIDTKLETLASSANEPPKAIARALEVKNSAIALVPVEKALEPKLAKALLPASPFAPRLTKAGYFTVPNLRQLARMQEQELATVSRFVIGRIGVGEVAFLYPVDLRHADLDGIVVIEKANISLYPQGTKHARPGEGINQPALLTFKNMRNAKLRAAAFRGMLLNAAARMGATFVHWDPEEGVWMIKVDGF